MPDTINILVPVVPKAKPRPRSRIAARSGYAAGVVRELQAQGAIYVQVYPDPAGRKWEEHFALMCATQRPESPLDGPLEVTIRAIYARPKRLMRKKDPDGLIPSDKKPDWDNVGKSVCDSLTQAGYWRDDGQIARAIVETLYAERDGMPRVEVEIGVLA